MINFLNLRALACFLLLRFARCETYRVGDQDQWNTGVNYLTWSTKYSFRVDDFLVFQYTKGEHNVYQVTEDTYRSCNASKGVFAKYRSGNDQIQLKEPKEYWFICDIAGHCLGGMRFGINVTAASPTSSSAGTNPSPPPSPSNCCSSQRGMPVIYLLVCVQYLLAQNSWLLD